MLMPFWRRMIHGPEADLVDTDTSMTGFVTYMGMDAAAGGKGQADSGEHASLPSTDGLNITYVRIQMVCTILRLSAVLATVMETWQKHWFMLV